MVFALIICAVQSFSFFWLVQHNGMAQIMLGIESTGRKWVNALH